MLGGCHSWRSRECSRHSKMGPPRVELGSYAPHAQRIPLPHGPASDAKRDSLLRVSLQRTVFHRFHEDQPVGAE